MGISVEVLMLKKSRRDRRRLLPLDEQNGKGRAGFVLPKRRNSREQPRRTRCLRGSLPI
jgi:hypothetical protein